MLTMCDHVQISEGLSDWLSSILAGRPGILAARLLSLVAHCCLTCMAETQMCWTFVILLLTSLGLDSLMDVRITWETRVLAATLFSRVACFHSGFVLCHSPAIWRIYSILAQHVLQHQKHKEHKGISFCWAALQVCERSQVHLISWLTALCIPSFTLVLFICFDTSVTSTIVRMGTLLSIRNCFILFLIETHESGPSNAFASIVLHS